MCTRQSFQNQLLVVRGCHELLSVKIGYRDRTGSHIHGAVQECLVGLELKEHVVRRRLSGQDMQSVEAGDDGEHGLEVAVIPQHPEKLQTLQQHVADGEALHEAAGIASIADARLQKAGSRAAKCVVRGPQTLQ